MPDNSQHEFLSIELNPHLLSTPFGVQTNWHVITGAPSCGKTTLINLLAENGFQTAPEGARIYMEREIASGRTHDEIRANMSALQRGIKNTQLEIESNLQPADPIFLDRGVPDTLAWYRIFGMDPNEFLLDCFCHRYASVFILDQLPLDLDGYRFEDVTDTGYLDAWHRRDYTALGYSISGVPVLPPEDRLIFVLDKLSERGLFG